MTSTERVLDLLAYLLAARRPVSANKLFEAFADEYSGSAEARDRKFSRDKEQLRDLGIAIVHVPGEEEDEGGYRIDRGAFYLPEIDLTPDERAALFAVGAAALRSALPLRSELAHALTKLRATNSNGEERAQPVIHAGRDRATAFEDLLIRAVADRKRLRLRYSDDETERLVDPYAFSARRSRFALVGYCHRRKSVRTFYADRVASAARANSSTDRSDFDVPSDFDPAPHLPIHPWQVRIHPPIDVELEFSADLAESGPQWLGVAPGLPCPATNLDGLIAQVLALGPGVVIRGPEQARARLRERLANLRTVLKEAA